jgi:hypothetical protein
MARSAIAASDWQSKKESGQIVEVEKSDEGQDETHDGNKYFTVVKLSDEEQTVTGVVLEPETFDAQQTIIGVDVIRKAAHDYLKNLNKTTKVGLQHEEFDQPLYLCESYIAPCDFSLGENIIKKDSWIAVMKIDNKNLWKKVKDSKYTGFSIGGRAKIKKIGKENE